MDDTDAKKPTCFIIMPISTPADARETYGGDGDHFQHVLHHLFVPAIEKSGFTPLSPVSTGAEIIHAEIIRKLETADLVLCDMSSLNANAFFELGIRTAVDKPVALVRDQHTPKVPFDTTLINHHLYDASLTPWTLLNEIERMSEHLLKTVNSSGKRNTLWRYFGLTTRAEIPAPASIEDKLNIILDALSQSRQMPLTAPIETGSSEEAFVVRVQRGVSRINAEFNVVSVEPGKVVLDLGEYAMADSTIARYTRLAKQKGIALTILRGVEWPTRRSRAAAESANPI